MANSHVEVWLRGPVPRVSPHLQPAAHALLQVREEVRAVAAGLDAATLHASPGGAATPAFHLFHMAGAMERLFTYARGEALSDAQRAALDEEKTGVRRDRTAEELVHRVEVAVDHALEQLRATPDAQLAAPRTVGRAALPSTVLGLLYHGAEHSARHLGQLVTTVKILRAAAR